MNKKVVNVLILDDNPIVGRCVEKRIEKVNSTYVTDTNIEIKPQYHEIGISNLKSTGEKIEKLIRQENIDILLLDRGFFNVIDPKKVKDQSLDKNKLYVKKGEKSVKIHEILNSVSFKKVKKFSSVIVYSFDDPSMTSEWYVEPATIKRQLKEAIGDKINSDDIEIVLTNSDLYHVAGIDLYENWGKEETGNYLFHGNKPDFALYGLFIGEILYHKIIRNIEIKRKGKSKSKVGVAGRNLVLLFIVFTALSIGGNAAYNYVSGELNNDFGLLLLTMIFSLVIPILLLIVKPEWIINIEE